MDETKIFFSAIFLSAASPFRGEELLDGPSRILYSLPPKGGIKKTGTTNHTNKLSAPSIIRHTGTGKSTPPTRQEELAPHAGNGTIAEFWTVPGYGQGPSWLETSMPRDKTVGSRRRGDRVRWPILGSACNWKPARP